MKKIGLITLTLLVILFIGRHVFVPKIVEKGFAKMAGQNLGVDRDAGLADGLHVYICGAGSPLPDPKRSGPCIGVLAGGHSFIFDAGTAGARNLGPMGFPIGRTEQIFLTHLHSDHIDGLGEMLLGTWINGGRQTPTPIVGPVGTAQVVGGFNTAYRIDSTFRTAHHGVEIANPAGFGGIATEINLNADNQTVFDKDGVKITAFLVNHDPVSPAFGYRVDYKDRAVAISGDTAYDPNVAIASKGVDVLFHEALNKDMVNTMAQAAKANGAKRLEKILLDIQDYHTTPVEAAKTAQTAGAKALVLYHIVPMLPSDELIPLFVKGAEAEFSGKITVSADGLIVHLPAGSDGITYKNGL